MSNGLKVFVSYRREETRHVAGRITDRIGHDRVFMDVDKIEPGADYADVITDAVASCAILIVVIGPMWLKVVNRRGQGSLMIQTTLSC